VQFKYSLTGTLSSGKKTNFQALQVQTCSGLCHVHCTVCTLPVKLGCKLKLPTLIETEKKIIHFI
jgi:hypothetical protein